MPPATPHDLSHLLKSLARELGFDLVGITRPTPSAHADAYHQWLTTNQHGEMHYLAKAVDERLDPTKKFPWAKSILCLALSYWQDPPIPAAQDSSPQTQDCGKITRYAWGRDYHKVFETKLHRLEKRLRDLLQPAPADLQVRTYVDTGPLLERELAARAGLGWIGKHTLLLHPQHGSWFLLGEMILSLELEPDSPIADHCGTCRRCIDACPTHAITPFSVDATKCISYLTLEHRTPIDPQFHAPMQQAGFVIGCDICQEVCPFNRHPLPTTQPDFAPSPPAPTVSLQAILQWQEQDWDKLTRGRAFRRAKLPMWQRNAHILAGS